MRKQKKVDSREVGLEIGLILGNHFFKTEYLHFGFWKSHLENDILEFPQAQEAYTDFIISHIPNSTETILDVGCGSGKFALKLIDMGYEVDCVSPSPVLTQHARGLLGNRSQIFECLYEQLQTNKRYDMILFSESFQYIPVEKALENSMNFLNDEGHLLICDFFKTDEKVKDFRGGGHKLSHFYKIICQYPFQRIKEIDITKEMAPTLRLLDEFLKNVGLPVWTLGFYFLGHNYPLLFRLLQWKYKKKIEKIQRRYLSGTSNAENFEIAQSYRLFLYQKRKDPVST